ncbi:MAG: polyprenyl synthetase family protein [Candidatus Kariarchaeaceae archaeon]
MNLEQANDPFESDRQLIIDWISEVIEEEYQLSVLKDMILPIFTNSKSKKLRPLVSLYSYLMIAGEDADISRLKYLCAAIEISHNASLIVDDIFDRDLLRRGEESFYVKYGTFAGLSAAYNLSAFVFDLATRTQNHDVVRVVGRVGTALSSALYLSKDLKSSKVITADYFMNLVYRKTTALFEGSAKGAGLLATKSDDLINKVTQFGILFGNAYQLRDDVLAIVGSMEDLGKPPDSDITNRFQSMITIEAMKRGAPEDVAVLKDFYLNGSNTDPEIIRELLISSGAVEDVIKATLEYRNQALEILREFETSRSRDQLIKLTNMINFQTLKASVEVRN